MKISTVEVWCSHPPILSGGRVYGGQVTRLMFGGRDVPPDSLLPRGIGLGDIHWHPPRVASTPRTVRSVHKVSGSGGKVYTVVVEGNRKVCTCVGFQYRRTCKHLQMV